MTTQTVPIPVPIQSLIETSSISNSNKYANYREGYLSIPLLLTLTSSTSTGGATAFAPNTTTTSADYSLYD